MKFENIYTPTFILQQTCKVSDGPEIQTIKLHFLSFSVQRFINQLLEKEKTYILGDPEVTANMCCNFAYPYWEGCVICSIYLR